MWKSVTALKAKIKPGFIYYLLLLNYVIHSTSLHTFIFVFWRLLRKVSNAAIHFGALLFHS